jgi:cytochrome P450
LLTLLLTARDTEGDAGGMSDKQLRDEAVTLFTAGHETTANALVWTWYLLAQNPAAEAELHAEVDRVLGDRPATAADVERLEYARRVLAESMRLYPPAWVIAREAATEYEVGGYRVPAGSVLLMSQFLLHRDARFWPHPERFDPSRFTDEARAARPRYAYFPFGSGPRSCIGEGFAWSEATVLLATLARRWRLELLPGQRVRLHPTITLRPRDPLMMRVVARG